MSREFETVIGLEVHIELLTETKMYCSCKNTFGKKENTVLCPVCAGYPGTLPAVNKRAVELAVRAGLALKCDINRRFKMSRKNYFYPDLPKGYQISQFDAPVGENGFLEIKGKKYPIFDIHLEEDAGKLYENGIDFNRCGIPLIELVTKPCFNSAAEAVDFLKELRLIMIYSGVSDCRIERGSMRCDVNVSVHRRGEPCGERCELKNVSGFSNVYDGILYEEKRQKTLVKEGKCVFSETRRWDPMKKESVILRSKEKTADYRYFDEPDFSEITLSEDFIEEVFSVLPMLPNKKRLYYESLGIQTQAAEDIVIDPRKDRIFNKCVEMKLCGAKILSGLINGIAAEFLNVKSDYLNENNTDEFCLALCKIGRLREKGVISSTAVKLLFENHIASGADIDMLLKELKLEQVSDSDYIEDLVRRVLDENPKSAEDYRKGKTNVLSFLVGRCMKLSEGKSDPVLCREAILNSINDDSIQRGERNLK